MKTTNERSHLKTPFSEIKLPATWAWKPISTDYRVTKKPKDRILASFETIPFVPMESVPLNGREAVRFELRRPSDIASGTYFEKGDVLLAKITPSFENGKQGLSYNIPAPFGVASTEIIPLQAITPGANHRFLFFYLLHPEVRAALVGKMEGSTGRQRVPESAVRDFPIPTPPLPEQEKIAAILWKIQRAIETEEKLIATARELKQSAMRQLFTHGLHGEPQKDTEIGLIPKSWRVARLAEFAHFQRGFDITKKAQQQGNVPVVSSGGIKSWHNEAAAKGPGVIIGRKGSIGSVHYIDQDYWPHDTTLWCTDFRANVPLFVYYRLLVLDLKRLDSGAANPALNRNFLHEELISWPDPDEQQEIANILQTIDRKISLHERKRATLQDLFQTLLHKLMTAEIRVANLDIDTREVKT